MNICIHDFICFQAVFTPFEFTFDFMNLIFHAGKVFPFIFPMAAVRS